eukprot:TRINITY_DN18273_c0_g1_i1.p1 TRINITY_DN18273_c0_g1~~TRINITY_DN18273_c0_g1_i1.p1  ORF type:complete len:671 (-),score=128.26 TRINITY_DN18273_c0_g1_i1:478-2490(-)
MCWAMANELQEQEGVPENHLRRQIAAAVRNIQWSYAIFWSISTRQEGVLEWGDGYYNGDIKTRKTMQPMELNADQMGLQRSEQLRELYESLSAGDGNTQAKRLSAALSPEDLTDSEWYYLVCMSFIFSPGQGLPGRVLENGHHIWLYNAPYADSKVFTRSLLAKSASIQTVLCFPFIGGVMELGVTELIPEEISLLRHITTSFVDFPKPVCSEQSASSPQNEDHEIVDAMPLEEINEVAECETQAEGGPPTILLSFQPYTPKEEIEFEPEMIEELQANIGVELNMGSSDDTSNGHDQHTDNSFMVEEINGTSQVHSRQGVDDEFSNGLHGSMNSSDCISESLTDPEKGVSSPKSENVNNLVMQGVQECNHTKLSSLDIGNNDPHYTRTLCTIFRNPHQLVLSPVFYNASLGSSFKNWRKGLDTQKPQINTSQKILKKILFNVACMHGDCSIKFRKEVGSKCRVWKYERDDMGVSHVLSERRRREKLNEKFLVLRSLVPSISKVDKVSILGDTIAYVKQLERRVEELEGGRGLEEFDARGRGKHPDIVERTSDNYGSNDIANGKKPLNKRKACDMNEVGAELSWVLSKDKLADVTITIIDNEVLIEMKCAWREGLLLEIVEAISNLQLDARSVQSSSVDGIFTLTLRSKFRGMEVASTGTIKKALQSVAGR